MLMAVARNISLLFILAFCLGCNQPKKQAATSTSDYELVILGNVQDAGSPHIGCNKACCTNLSENDKSQRMVTSFGLINNKTHKAFLFEASPDMSEQLRFLHNLDSNLSNPLIDGIFLSHAHIGHYTGLMYLGKEAIHSHCTPVFAMPRMHAYLEKNGPWSQLVELQNIELRSMQNGEAVDLDAVKVVPIRVPHRDEFSETVGFKIIGPNKSALFIPDIDKWSKWDSDIKSLIVTVDYAFLDATFFSGDEINSRDISEIPHPFVCESMELFKDLSQDDKAKIHFIHMNHTNPMLNENSKETKEVLDAGHHIARLGNRFDL